ncbi:hypothetical protein EV121DRAFT_293554 [Schizophyllum commune]
MSGPIPVEANTGKAQGNSAFAAGDYEQAATHYSRAVELAPQWAVPRANRAFAYMKQRTTRLDGRWGKGYARLAEAMLMDVEAEEVGEEAMNGAPGGTREEGRRKMLEEAQEALHAGGGAGGVTSCGAFFGGEGFAGGAEDDGRRYCSA